MGVADWLQKKRDESPPDSFYHFENDDQIGYRAVNTGPDVTPENARLEAINPTAQREFESILWRMRQR